MAPSRVWSCSSCLEGGLGRAVGSADHRGPSPTPEVSSLCLSHPPTAPPAPLGPQLCTSYPLALRLSCVLFPSVSASQLHLPFASVSRGFCPSLGVLTSA